MQRFIRKGSWLAGVAAALGLAGPAASELMPFTGSITFEIAGSAPAPIALLSGSLDALPDGSVVLPAGAFGTAATFPVGDAFLSAIAVRANSFLGGTLGPTTRPGFGGSAVLTGSLGLALDPGLGLANLSVPLRIGSPASISASTSDGLGGYAFFSAFFSPWNTAATTLFGTQQGVTTRSTQVSGSRATTPGGAVSLSLVSPVVLFRQGGPGAQIRTLPGVARMNIDYGPEPSALVLICVGAAALVAYGRRLA